MVAAREVVIWREVDGKGKKKYKERKKRAIVPPPGMDWHACMH